SATITCRHLPPTRRSISTTVTSPRFACHQRSTSSGVVHAFQTRCLRASNSLVIRICSSVGSVSFAVPLAITLTISFLSLELLQHDVQLVEPLRPRALVALHPVVDGLERPAVHPIQPLPSFFAHVDRPHFAEHPEVLGHLWLRQPESGHEVVDRALAA